MKMGFSPFRVIAILRNAFVWPQVLKPERIVDALNMSPSDWLVVIRSTPSIDARRTTPHASSLFRPEILITPDILTTLFRPA